MARISTPGEAAAGQWRHYPQQRKAPPSAPNVLLVLTDDVGFGACSTFGGLIPTPALDRLAAQGIRYNAFHTTAMCSPTRAALLTGRNHHSVGFGAISNYSVDAPGYTSVLPKSAATIARVLRDTGYDTAMFGKNHNTPEWELGPLGPYDRWPIGLGFNYFYGFNACQMDQFSPALIENLNALRPPEQPDYHLDRDLADKAINWFQVQKAIRPDQPFFIYWAPGTLHEPHQAPADWIAKFHGMFDRGWDELRRDVYARQKAMGVIPEDAVLTERPSYLPAWASLTDDTKRLFARQMEVAAAQLSHFDHQFGRMIAALEERGELENTVVVFIQGDNGACQEYEYGNTNSDIFGLITETPESMFSKLDLLGGPDVHGTYAPGWGWAMNTPLAESKQVASHLGGIRNGLVISWLKGIEARGEVRSQFGHVIDIAPTILDVIGITPPEVIDGVPQSPIEGTSLAYTFNEPDAPNRHVVQYFEMLGNRGVFNHGWMASTIPPRPPYGDTSGYRPEEFAWGLYNLDTDWSQSSNIAAEYPDHLRKLKAAFERCAEEYSIYPLANDQMERMKDSYRPQALTGNGPRTYPAGPTRYRGSSFPPIKPGWTAEAVVELDFACGSGVIFATGSRLAGADLRLEDGITIFTINPAGDAEHRTQLVASIPLSSGRNRVKVSITDATPATASIWVNGEEVASEVVRMFPHLISPETYVGECAVDQRPEESPPSFHLKSLTVSG